MTGRAFETGCWPVTITLVKRNGTWALSAPDPVDDQWRVPKGNGERSGRWVDMPHKVLEDAARAISNQNRHSALSVALKPASDEDKAEYKERFGKSIPPAWTDVYVDFGEGAELTARGVLNGKTQYLYSEAYHEKQDAAKYARLDDVFAAVPALDKALSGIGDNPTKAVARLMYLEGIRVGSTDKQVGKVMAYGASTLRAKHAKANDDGSVTLSFIAKEGIPVEYHITDPELVSFITESLAQAEDDPEYKLFTGTNSSKTLAFLKEVSGLPEMKNHDLRTLLANRIAAAEVRKAMPPKPTTKKEAMALRKKIAEIVAAQLRNKPAQALSSYINPAVFAPLMQEVA